MPEKMQGIDVEELYGPKFVDEDGYIQFSRQEVEDTIGVKIQTDDIIVTSGLSLKQLEIMINYQPGDNDW